MKQINQNNINMRIKELRKVLKMTQVSFSQVISLSSGYLAGIETEKRKVNDRLIKLVCSSFNANEQWLRTGEGPMFSDNDNLEIIRLSGLFKELKRKYRDFIFKTIDLLLKMQDETTIQEQANSTS